MTFYSRTAQARARRAEAARWLRLAQSIILLVAVFAFLLAVVAQPAEGQGGEHTPDIGCTKVEFADGVQTYVTPADGNYTIKAGTLVETFYFQAGTEIAATNSKDISYVIWCPVPPSSSTEPPTTTVEPPTTTEQPPCQEDEPCWDCRTMGNGICGGPPTTETVPSTTTTPPPPVAPSPPAVPVVGTPTLTG